MNKKILTLVLSGFLLLGGCQSASASAGGEASSNSASQSAEANRAGQSAVVVEYEKTENPAWAKLMYLKDGSVETCTLDKSQTLEELGIMLMTGEPVKAESAGKDVSILEAVDSPSWEGAAFRPMTNEEFGLLSPIYVHHQYLYHSLGKTAAFLPEEELTDQQIRVYLNLAAVQLEMNPDWLAPAETADDIRQYDGQEFLKLAQSCYPGLPDNALEQLSALDTKENDLGNVFLWYDSQSGRVSAASAGLGGVLPAPMVKLVRREGDKLEFTLIDRSGPVCEKTFVCEKMEKGYAVNKVEIRELG